MPACFSWDKSGVLHARGGCRGMDGFPEEPTLGRALGKGCLAEGTDEALEWVLYQRSSRPFRV